jgi:hypothetical protein
VRETVLELTGNDERNSVGIRWLVEFQKRTQPGADYGASDQRLMLWRAHNPKDGDGR